MKRFLLVVTLFMLVGFTGTPLASNDIPSSADHSGVSDETDRVLVKVVDEAGRETVESILVEELDQFTEGQTFGSSSVLDDGQQFVVLEPDYIRSAGPFNESPEPMLSWGTERIGTKRMAEVIMPQQADVIVAVIDTGVDNTHAFLTDRVVGGYDVIERTKNAMDVHYHGTHVAGIIVDSTPENVKIMPIRALDDEGKGYDSDLVKAIHYAVHNGADIINLSVSGRRYSSHLAEAIDYALANDVLIVVASGNEGGNTANYYPAGEPKVVVVTAIDQNDQIARFSNTGATVDVSAPGVGITSTVPGGRYASMDGTSMAVPYVSGVAAMLKLDDPTRSIQEIERLLKKYVDDRGAVGWDHLFGEGVVNVTSFDEQPLVENQRPVVELRSSSFNIKKAEQLTVDLSRYVTDPDGDAITYSADSGKVSGSTFTFSTEMIGEHVVTISATDGNSAPVYFKLYIAVEAAEEVELPDATKKAFITLPTQREIALDTEWNVKFNQQLTEREVIEIKLLKGDIEIPVSLHSSLEDKVIIVSPNQLYEPETEYRLIILLENGKNYQMRFVTEE